MVHAQRHAAPVIGEVMPPLLVVTGTPVVLWAENIQSSVDIADVYCDITPPDYESGDPLQRIYLSWVAGNSRYQATYYDFTKAGTYTCTFYARDNFGLISSPVQSAVTVGDIYEADDTPSKAKIFTVGELQQHSFHIVTDQDWVKFHAPTGFVFKVDITPQRGTNSDVRLELYCEHPFGNLELVDFMDYEGTMTNTTEGLALDLKTNPFGLLSGTYYVRVTSANPNLFGPGSEYDLEIYVHERTNGGVILLNGSGGGLFDMGYFYIALGPPEALEAGAGWRIMELTNQTYYSDTATYGLPIPTAPAHYHLTFSSIPGFSAPNNRDLPLIGDETTSFITYYLYTNLLPRAISTAAGTNNVFRITYLASADQNYAIEESTNLVDWVPLSTNLIPQEGLLHLNITNAPSQKNGFYQARLIERIE